MKCFSSSKEDDACFRWLPLTYIQNQILKNRVSKISQFAWWCVRQPHNIYRAHCRYNIFPLRPLPLSLYFHMHCTTLFYIFIISFKCTFLLLIFLYVAPFYDTFTIVVAEENNYGGYGSISALAEQMFR